MRLSFIVHVATVEPLCKAVTAFGLQPKIAPFNTDEMRFGKKKNEKTKMARR